MIDKQKDCFKQVDFLFYHKNFILNGASSKSNRDNRTEGLSKSFDFLHESRVKAIL